ncbi:hypothetical protein SCUCBS95973_002028 [Sporothrix curviconia]|uniref:C6 zinc finger domain containing protein n=1 Tax=Sporothrix curviconia TaxID=1260050 RepID=A0ABP0B3C0_9PEZI
MPKTASAGPAATTTASWPAARRSLQQQQEQQEQQQQQQQQQHQQQQNAAALHMPEAASATSLGLDDDAYSSLQAPPSMINQVDQTSLPGGGIFRPLEPVPPQQQASPDHLLVSGRGWTAGSPQRPWEDSIAFLLDCYETFEAQPDFAPSSLPPPPPPPPPSFFIGDGSDLDGLPTNSTGMSAPLRQAASTAPAPALASSLSVLSMLALNHYVTFDDSNNNNNNNTHHQPPLSLASEDYVLVSYYKQNLMSFYSAKSSRSAKWNFYSFAIQVSEHQPDSRLRHGIVAWAAGHRVLRNQCSRGVVHLRHYSRARAAAAAVRTDLAREAREAREVRETRDARDAHDAHDANSGGTVVPAAATSGKLRLLLSTVLFLSYCDILSGDNDALVHELAGIRQLLAFDWPRFLEALGPLEARILVWLSYFDLRSSLWTRPRPAQQHQQQPHQPHQQQQQYTSLVHFFARNGGFAALRSLGSGRHYLTDCFGAALPQDELKDDLLQEPTKTLSDEMLPSGTDGMARNKLQGLGATAKCLAATIMLNRIVQPDVRTDAESQHTAHEIIRIARRLHASHYLCSPRNLIWPMPVFVAGIEVVDPVYQDWVLNYLSEVAGLWGTSTRKTGELLRRVIEQQEAQNRRAAGRRRG